MIDKEWLEKVNIALIEYEKKQHSPQSARDFVNFLYFTYGVIPPVPNRDNK
jgi:hypothetical protein